MTIVEFADRHWFVALLMVWAVSGATAGVLKFTALLILGLRRAKRRGVEQR